MRKLKITDVNRELSHKKMWRGTGARRRFSGERKKQVGVGKFPPSWFESMRTRQVLMDRSEVIFSLRIGSSWYNHILFT